MKNPLTVLFEEHKIILSAIEIAKQADILLAKDEMTYERVIRQLIHFLKEYADQYHHSKEEKILFPEMNKKNELLKDGVIKEMTENHEDFRNLIKGIELFLSEKDYPKAKQQLHLYTEALMDHIAVENDEVFQMADTLFDADELEKIFFRFDDSDREIGEHNKMELIHHLKEIRKNLLQTH